MDSPAPHRHRGPLLVAGLILINAALIIYLIARPSGAESRTAPREVVPRETLGVGEQAVVSLFDQLSPAVAYITTLGHVRSRFGMDVRRVPQGSGSGFVWDKAGHIVTNFHVIAKASEAIVTLADGKEYPAKLVGAAPDHDLAVLRITVDDAQLRPIPVGTSHDLKVGQFAMAIGNPFGLDHSLTTGVVSALDREIDALSGRKIYGVVQTDAAINPGNSGGPLIDSAGRLIGVNTAIHSPSGASAGIGFAVPVDTVNRIVPQLIEHGHARRPGIGVLLGSSQIAARFRVKGVPIRGVTPGSAAERGGLTGMFYDRRGRVRLGDVIVGIGADDVETIDDLMRAIDPKEVGDEVVVRVRRGDNLRELTLRLEAID